MSEPSALTIRASAVGLLRVLISDATISDPAFVNSIGIKAIWDTGATGSVISKNVAARLGLLPSGQSMVNTANGTVLQNTYTISITLPQGLRIDGVIATEVDGLTGDCDALIGMDIITLGDFSITNLKGNTVMSFRIPSQHEVDFVKKINAVNEVRIAHAKAGLKATSKCICGSGKAHKNCHGKA